MAGARPYRPTSVAAGNSLSAETLAKAMWAAGACTAMQLDINSPYVLTSLFFAQADGSTKAAKFVSGMSDNPARFFSTATNRSADPSP